jgi:hypothetical protein
MVSFGKHRLVAHPDHRPKAIKSVTVEVSRNERGYVVLTYAVEPAASLLLPERPAERSDDLWRSTCFELFFKLSGGGYHEMNFAPMGAWNAFGFSDWRRGMKPLNLLAEPHVVDIRLGDRRGLFPQVYELGVSLAPELMARSSGKTSLTAVIEEKSGHKSYWALAHPPSGPPDFHHPACFVLELPPAPAL